MFIEAGPRRPPQIEIEEVRQLRGRGLRDQLDAVLEAVRIDDAMQQLGLQLRCKLSEAMNELVWQADECSEFAGSETDCFALDTRRTIEMGANLFAPIPRLSESRLFDRAGAGLRDDLVLRSRDAAGPNRTD